MEKLKHIFFSILFALFTLFFIFMAIQAAALNNMWFIWFATIAMINSICCVFEILRINSLKQMFTNINNRINTSTQTQLLLRKKKERELLETEIKEDKIKKAKLTEEIEKLSEEVDTPKKNSTE